MPNQRAIDIETSEFTNEDIEINGKYRNVNCKYLWCKGICAYCYKNQNNKLMNILEKKRSERYKSLIANQNYSKKLKQWTVKTDPSYTNDNVRSFQKLTQTFDVCRKFHNKDFHLNYELGLIGNICITIGNYDIMVKYPNTSELRYEILYQRLPKKIFDPLIKIIIEYLLFDDGWKENFVWSIELLPNWNSIIS
jgi:hypothetical protein